MATNIVQMTDGAGNKQYPVTSAEAVGMPDGSGNLQNYLDKRATELNISELYPTKGIGGSNKYDLATAIAQVDSKYRTIQGLKITFINNATGKTETWVYDGDTFTTKENWKLSNDSEKLSEEIMKAQSTAQQSIDGTLYIGELIEGQYLTSNNTLSPLSSAYTTKNYIPIESSKQYYYTGKYGGACVGVLYFDANKSIIGNIEAGTTAELEPFITPENCAYIRVSSLNGVKPTISVGGESLKDLSKVKDVAEEAISKSTISNNAIIGMKDYELNIVLSKGYYLAYNSDNLTPLSNAYYTEEFVEVEPNTIYGYNGIYGNAATGVRFYNINKERIGDIGNDGNKKIFTTPTDCFYIKACSLNNTTCLVYKLSERIECTTESGYRFNNATGYPLVSDAAYIYTEEFIEVLPNTYYFNDCKKVADNVQLTIFYDIYKTIIGVTNLNVFKTDANCAFIRMCSSNSDILLHACAKTIRNLAYDKSIERILLEIESIKLSNPLWGKKYVSCGDSFTEGDFRNDATGTTKFDSGKYKGKNKVYPYYIGMRNNMEVINEAKSGTCMAFNNDGAFSNTRYKEIPADADYITFWFGINDWHGKIPLGEIDNNTDNTTFYGAWNLVLDYIIKNHPYAKLGIIITNVASEEYRNAEIAIAKKFGIPYLDMMGDYQVPVIFGRNADMGLSPEIEAFRKEKFYVSNDPLNDHPNQYAHEYQSYFIENWLRSL